MITAHLVGWLGGDIEVRRLDSGKSVTRFRLACDDVWRDVNGVFQKNDAVWFTVEAWGALAEGLEGLEKGTELVLSGRWKQQSFQDKDGQQRTTRFVVAEAAGVNLARQNKSADERSVGVEEADGAEEENPL